MTSLTAVASGTFAVIGAGLLVVAGRHLIRRLTFVRRSTVAAGLVVGLREERDGMETQTFRYPRIRFRTASGREITVESGMALGGTAWRIGDQVSVRYSPDHPEAAEVSSLVALWGPTMLIALLAVVFAGVGIGLWFGFIPV